MPPTQAERDYDRQQRIKKIALKMMLREKSFVNMNIRVSQATEFYDLEIKPKST